MHEATNPDGPATADLGQIPWPGDQSVVDDPLYPATRNGGYLADDSAGTTVTAPERHRADRPSIRASVPVAPDLVTAPPAIPPADPSAAPVPGRAGLAARYRTFRAHLASPLFRNAYALMLNTGATGLLGVVYWILAARYYPAVDVGRASAAYSAMNLVSGFTAANILGAAARFLPEAGRRTSGLVLRAYLFSSAASVIVALLFLASVGHWGGASYAELRGMIPLLFFIACVIAWGIFTLQDGVLTGLRSAVWVPVENATFGIVKIVLLLAFAASMPAFGIPLSWMLPVIVSLPLMNLLIFGKIIPDHVQLTGDRRPPTMRQVGRFLAGDYTGALCVLAVTNLVPILVAIRVGPNMNAYFYMAWTIGSVLFLVAMNMATSLTVEGAFDSQKLLANCLAALRRTIRLLAPLALATALLAPVALGLFGPQYARYGTPILVLLAIATLPKMLTELYLGALRAQSRTRQVAAIQIARCALVIVLTFALTGTTGMVGAGIAVLVSELAMVIVIFVVPGLKSAIHRSRRGAVKTESGRYDQSNVRNPELRTAEDIRKPASKVRSPKWLPVAALCAAAALGLGLFLVSLGRVTASLGRMNGLGLISVMPASMLAGIMLLVLAFVLALGLARPRPILLGVMLVAIVVCLDGVTAMAEPAPRFPTAYWIAGFVDYVSRTGHTAPGLSAYFSWPGFFEAVAWVEHLVGSRNLMPVLRIWPLAVDLLALVPLAMILMRLRASWRAKWFAAFVFTVGNWVGQDYFSPQSAGYLLYLLIIALLLTWFTGTRPVQDGPAARTPSAEPPRVDLPDGATVQFERLPAELPRINLPDDATVQFERVPAEPRPSRPDTATVQFKRVPAKSSRWTALLTRPISGDLPSCSSTRELRVVLLTLIIVIFVSTTESHQLTPFFMIAACAGLVLVRRCQLRGLPVLFGVIFAAWVSFVAVAFWSGHMSSLFSGLGALGSNVTSSVTDRISGSASVHAFVLYSRAAFAGTAIILAVAGLVRRRRRALDDRVAFVLMCVPFAGFAMQGYGGEMALRIYLFALPGIAILAAYLFFPEATAPHRTRLMVLVAAICAVAATLVFFVARYGNEAFEQTPPGELSAMNYIYAHDSSGVRLAWLSVPPTASGTPEMPWQYRDLEKVNYVAEKAPVNPAQVSGLVAQLRALGPRSYLITTSTQEASLEQESGYPDGWGQEFRAAMRAFPGVRVAYADSTAVIYTLHWPRGVAATPMPATNGAPVRSNIWTPIGLALLAVLLALLVGREFLRVWYPDPPRIIRWFTLCSIPLLLLFVAVIIIRFATLS